MIKQTKITSGMPIISKALFALLCIGITHSVIAQSQLPLIKATDQKALITDGENVEIEWGLDPHLKPDTYFVNIPFKESEVSLKTDQDQITFRTKPGKSYDFIVLLSEKDSCYVRISSVEPPTPVRMDFNGSLPQSISFTLIGSRVYFIGMLNGDSVNIQFDLGAGTNVVNKMSTEKLGLTFSKKTLISNTQGTNEARTSPDNALHIGGINWTGVPVTEVGNMEPYEDLIIGNGLFINKIIEIDYDKNEFTVHEQLPLKAKFYTKQPLYYEQNRPKFEAEIINEGKKYKFWFLFDTGRDGSMLIGEDFTGENANWQNLNPLMMLKGRKIVRLDAIIAGEKITDIVTNAADPSNPQGRPTLFGNQILNHFNVILDNRNGMIYLKPNSRWDEPYADYQRYLKDVSEMKNR